MRTLFTKIALVFLTVSVSNGALACLGTPTVNSKVITSNYGWRLHPVDKIWKFHKGMDLRATIGDPILSAHSGVVTYSGWVGGGGNAIEILGNDGIRTRYMHLSKYGVRSGQNVSVGQPIGLAGNTGHSGAPHLHFVAIMDGHFVDPKPLLCETLPQKPGAGPEKPLANSDIGGISAPLFGGGGMGGPVEDGSLSTFTGYGNMSMYEIMRTEAEKRFMNPSWHQLIATCGYDTWQQEIDGKKPQIGDCKTYFLREMMEIQAFRNWMFSEKRDIHDSIESILATRLAKKSKRDIVPPMDE